MPAITDLPRHAEIHGPKDPQLAKLWALAVGKFEAATERQPETRAEWRAVIAEYGRLLRKRHGTLGQIIQERCAEAPGGD